MTIGGTDLAGYIAFAFLLFVVGSLGALVTLRGRSAAHRAFLGFAILIAIWMTSNYFENEPLLSGAVRTTLLQIDFATALLSGYFFWIFARNFPREIRMRPAREIAYALPLAAFVTLSFTPLVAARVVFTDDRLGFDLGTLFPAYGVTLSAYFFAGLSVLFRKFLSAKGVERQQILFVLVGFSFSVTIGLAVNLLLQNVLPVDIFRLGVYGLIFLIAGMAYAIIKHHLFDIKIIAAEALAFFLCVVLLMQVFFSQSTGQLVFSGSLFVLVFALLIAFLRSVLLEVRRREQIQLLAADLATANEKLAELSEMKSNFVSIASHQLRAPIGGVRGYLLLMREGDFGALTAKAKKILDQCTDQIDHLLHVINMFLDVTKVEAGKLALDRTPTDLRALARAAASDNRLAAANKRLALRVSVPRQPVVLAVDGPKVRDVFFNLIENAIKYTEHGKVTATLAADADMVEFRVRDTGLGIPPEEVPKLFAKFVRAGGGFRVAHGSGLGLYIVKTITEAHGGRAFVASEGEGKGSTFGVRFPAGGRARLPARKSGR